MILQNPVLLNFMVCSFVGISYIFCTCKVVECFATYVLLFLDVKSAGSLINIYEANCTVIFSVWKPAAVALPKPGFNNQWYMYKYALS